MRCEFGHTKFATNNLEELGCAQTLRNINSENGAVTYYSLRMKEAFTGCMDWAKLAILSNRETLETKLIRKQFVCLLV